MARIWWNKATGMYHADLRINGERNRDPLSKYKDLAKVKLAERVAMRSASRHGITPENVPWEFLTKKYQEYQVSQGLDAGTRYFTRRLFEVIEDEIHITHVNQMTPQKAIDLQYKMTVAEVKHGNISKAKYGKVMTGRLIRELKTVMNWAEKMDYVKLQKWTMVEVSEPKGRIDFYEFEAYDELLQALYKAGDPDMLTAAYTMGRAGLRLGEMYHLEWADVQLSYPRIYFESKPHFNWRIKGDEQNVKYRNIPIMDEGLLTWLQSIARPSGYVLSANRPAHVDTFEKRLSEALKATGVRTHRKQLGIPHLLRHTFGSHCAQMGKSLEQIGEWMGHESKRTTEVYTHLMPGQSNGFSFKKSLSTFCPLSVLTTTATPHLTRNNAELKKLKSPSKTIESLSKTVMKPL